MPKDLAGFKAFVMKQYPNMTKSQMEQLDAAIQAKQAEQIAGAGVPLNEVQTDPTLRSIQAQQVASGKYRSPADIKAEQQKKETEHEATGLLESTLRNYQNIPDSERTALGAKAAVPFLNKFLAPNATEYEAGLKGEAPALAKVFGGQGSGLRITQAEINSWVPYLPSVHKTEEQNRADVLKLNTILEGRFGKGNGLDPALMQQFGVGGNNSQGAKLQATTGNSDNPINGALNFLLGGAKNVAQDINAGVVANMTAPTRQRTADQAIQTAQSLEEQSLRESNPQKAALLHQQSQALLGEISRNAQSVAQTFSPDVKQNPLTRGAVAGAQVAGAAELGLWAAELVPELMNGGWGALSAVGNKTILELAGDIVNGAKSVSPRSGTLNKAVRYLTTTKGKTAKAMSEAASNATEDLNWENVVKTATEFVSNKGKPAQRALQDVLAEESPASIASPRTLSGTQGLEMRQGLGNQLPSNYFSNELAKVMSGGKSVPRNEAVNALRYAVSQELKRVAPDIKNADEMYSLISKLHGDVPTWIKRIALLEIAKHSPAKDVPVVGTLLKSIPL